MEFVFPLEPSIKTFEDNLEGWYVIVSNVDERFFLECFLNGEAASYTRGRPTTLLLSLSS